MRLPRLECGLLAVLSVFATDAISEHPPQAEEGLEVLLFMDVPVEVTSTLSEQRLSQAPSVMTVVTRKEILQSGAKDLMELLYYVNGVDVGNGDVSGVNLSIRGIREAASNAKVLFLVDGHPMNNPSSGNWNAFGLAGIKQVEILRGPGSALYGDHAFADPQ